MNSLAGNFMVCPRLEINGELIDCIDTVTMRGLESIASILGSPFTHEKAWMPFIGIGQGEVAPSTEDYALENEKFRKEAHTIWAELNQYKATTSFNANEPEDEFILREVGLFDKIAGGILGVRWVTAEDITIEPADILVVTCIVIIA